MTPATRSDFPGEDLPGPFHIVLLIGVPGREDTFASVVDADDLAGVRDFLDHSVRSKSLYRYAKGEVLGCE